LRGQSRQADKMLIVPVDQNGRGRARDDIDPAAGERKGLRRESTTFGASAKRAANQGLTV